MNPIHKQLKTEEEHQVAPIEEILEYEEGFIFDEEIEESFYDLSLNE